MKRIAQRILGLAGLLTGVLTMLIPFKDKFSPGDWGLFLTGLVLAGIFLGYREMVERWDRQEEKADNKQKEAEAVRVATQEQQLVHDGQLNALELEYSRRIVHVDKEWQKTWKKIHGDILQAAAGAHGVKQVLREYREYRPQLTEVDSAKRAVEAK